MPQMDWDAFQEAHYRPHLVIANMIDPNHGGASVSVLAHLAEALAMSGNYAVKMDGNDIQAAFEIDLDAEKFAAAVMAGATVRSHEWSSQAAFRMDLAAQKRVSTALKRLRLKTAKGR